MQFNSYSYLIYLALAVLLFWGLPTTMRRGFVLVVSLVFYASWGVPLVVLPVAMSAATYGCALIMTRHPRSKTAGLWLGIGTLLSVLAYFKYRAFAAEVAFGLLGLVPGTLSGTRGIALALGLSFYTFEAISYLLDVRQGRVKEIRFGDLLLFVLFWPHLLAGPIVRVRELVPQLNFKRAFEARFVSTGISRILVGLVQKNLVANSLAGWVDDGFLEKIARLNSTIDVWTLAVAFGLQIYFDFAAYSNIAIGSAQLIGVTLPENFNCPYWAGSPAEFWARWHMTLSRWVRDYVFFPVNARYGARMPLLCASMIVVMSLVGLWHGAGWGFILWGAMHGVYLVLYRAYQSQRGVAAQNGRIPWAERQLVRAVTLGGIVAAWIPFRSTTLEQTGILLKTMFTGFDLRISYSVNFYLVTALLTLCCVAEPWLRNGLVWAREQAGRSHWRGIGFDLVLRPLLWSLALVLFMAFDDQDTIFIYFQF
jgi:D-alanyl-lipoteichoic acid acyltransferase DltB (MBOAT superfamily)